MRDSPPSDRGHAGPRRVLLMSFAGLMMILLLSGEHTNGRMMLWAVMVVAFSIVLSRWLVPGDKTHWAYGAWMAAAIAAAIAVGYVARALAGTDATWVELAAAAFVVMQLAFIVAMFVVVQWTRSTGSHEARHSVRKQPSAARRDRPPDPVDSPHDHA